MDIHDLVAEKKFVLLLRESQWGEWVSVFTADSIDDLDKVWDVYSAYKEMFHSVSYGTGKEITMYMDGAPYSGPSINEDGWKGTGHQCLPKEALSAYEEELIYEEKYGRDAYLDKYFWDHVND